MNDSTIWWLAAGGLIVTELVSGTFYLLMLSLGLAAAALAAHAGCSLPWQWVTAATVGGGSVLAWHLYKKAQPETAPAKANRDVNMDIGETVQVQSWPNGNTCKVKYRGALWDAALMPGETATLGAHTIAEVVGSRLMLKKLSTS